jgi:heat-inducible transcriptional repressor
MLLDELKKYLFHIGLIKEYKALKKLYTKEVYNKKFIYKNDLDEYENINLEEIEKGMHFFKNYLLLRDIVNDKNVFKNFLIIGDVYTDFFAITKAKEGLNE